MLNKNLLKNFKKLINEGFSAKLKVTNPHSTIPSWPCMFSGLDVNQLGYYTFIHPIKGIFNSSVWKDKSIFSFKDIRTFALNIPGSYPAWKINGEIISGILSPSLSCYPKELEAIIKKKWIIEGKNLNEIFKAFEMKKSLFLRKMQEDFELMIFVIRVPDAISHRVLGDKRLISRYMDFGYKKIDDFLGEIFSDNEFDNIIIFSDHGLKFYNKVLHFPRWLEKNGLISFSQMETKKIKNILLKLYDIIRPFLKIHISKKILRRLFNYEKRELEQKKEIKLDSFDKENPTTTIQKLTSNIGALFLYGDDKMRKNLIKKALERSRFIENFEVYDRSGFPDFLITLKDNYIFTKEPSFFLTRRTEVFSHTNQGFFIASGKDIKKGKKDLINFSNIAPTILKLLKIKKQDHMKGNALDIFL